MKYICITRNTKQTNPSHGSPQQFSFSLSHCPVCPYHDALKRLLSFENTLLINDIPAHSPLTASSSWLRKWLVPAESNRFLHPWFEMRETTLISWSEMLTVMFISGEKETPHPPFFSGEKKYSSADRRDSEQRWAPWKQLDWKNVVEQFQWMHLWENKPLADANYRVAVYLFIKSNASMVPDLYFGIICILNALCAVAGCFSAAGTPC